MNHPPTPSPPPPQVCAPEAAFSSRALELAGRTEAPAVQPVPDDLAFDISGGRADAALGCALRRPLHAAAGGRPASQPLRNTAPRDSRRLRVAKWQRSSWQGGRCGLAPTPMRLCGDGLTQCAGHPPWERRPERDVSPWTAFGGRASPLRRCAAPTPKVSADPSSAPVDAVSAPGGAHSPA